MSELTEVSSNSSIRFKLSPSQIKSQPRNVAYILSLLKLALGVTGVICLSCIGKLFANEKDSWSLEIGKRMSYLYYFDVAVTGIIGILGWKYDKDLFFTSYTVACMKRIGLMLSIFAIVMNLIHFASAASQPDDVGRGVVLMLGFLVSAALFAPSIIVGHKSKEKAQKVNNSLASYKNSPVVAANFTRSRQNSPFKKQTPKSPQKLPEDPLKAKIEPLEHQVFFEGRYEYGDPGWQYENSQEPKISSKTSANI
ncbi:Oidioi.mRNA.OKI2018_I69.chr1.g1105.t1.cds [Oikopleura dioica]|uniref:Oidioi.mRNA.OKI2018_I69.chr1.g1105.t1.cds n=1 Tax=Oikopleura dioica TaxID=34765 RepID=A0ABN7STA0_OIKDI|nr:Oidioi.mRNA.OKI2018_I69.chr1.g1105.t1.cds [Oikopleura dioica]